MSGPDCTASLAPVNASTLPRPIGSSDALLLARFAQAQKTQRRLTTIVTAEPADTQRLEGELPFFAPELRVAVFPDWETLPYDTFSPHQDLISERLATLWRIQQGEVDVVLMPASTALVRLAPPSFLAGYTFHFKQKAKLNEAALKAQLTLAGYTHVSQVVSPGEYAVRGGLIDLFPMGSLVPYRVDLFGDESTASAPSTPTASAASTPCPKCACCPAASFRWTKTRAPRSAPAGARRWKATRPRCACTRTSAPASPPPASSTTCRSSSTARRRSSTTSVPARPWPCTARSTKR